MATHSSILPGEPSWTEEPGELGAMVMENAPLYVEMFAKTYRNEILRLLQVIFKNQ